MSHRRIYKDNKKNRPQSIMEQRPVTEEESEALFDDIVQRSNRNFKCPHCSSSLHTADDQTEDNGGITFYCMGCGRPLPIVIPTYLGPTEDIVLGYQLLDLLDDGTYKFHYLGILPKSITPFNM